MKIGSTEISNIKIGSTSINRVIKDGVIYWEVTTTTISPTTTIASTTTISPTTTIAPTTISATAIAGVTVPVTGATPVTTVTAGTGYTGTVAWSGSPSTFLASTIYTATITLTATAGYTLVGVGVNQFTIAGSSPTATNAANSGVITAAFPATDVTGYNANYQTVYNAMTNKPSVGVADAQNTLVQTLDTAGIWAKMDVFYLTAQQSNAAGEAYLNWVTPASYTLSPTAAGLTFTSLQGFTGDGTHYFTTGYNMSTSSIHTSQNSLTLGAYIRTNSAISYYALGAGTEPSRTYIGLGMPNAFGDLMSGSWITSTTINNTTGCWIVSRTASNSLILYRNRNNIGNRTNASSALANSALLVMSDVTYNQPMPTELSCAWVSAGLSVGEVSTITNAIETYMDYNSKGVIAPTTTVAPTTTLPTTTFGGNIYTDNFDSLLAGVLGGQGNWVAINNLVSVKDVSGDKRVYSPTSGSGGVVYNNTVANDQYSKCIIEELASGIAIGLGVRMSGTSVSNYNGYTLLWSSSLAILAKYTNGTRSTLGSNGTAPAVGDIIELRVIGTQLSAWKNGVIWTSVGTNGYYTDVSYSSGKVGVTSNGGSTGTSIDNWEGGDL